MTETITVSREVAAARQKELAAKGVIHYDPGDIAEARIADLTIKKFVFI